MDWREIQINIPILYGLPPIKPKHQKDKVTIGDKEFSFISCPEECEEHEDSIIL